MKLAISLAENQKYFTGTNPSVGCVITKNNKIISYTQSNNIKDIYILIKMVYI